jgi:uncharacterized repeat protein (TIGR02543 family)/LPXTG-motif cell wall-anchored protein
MTRDGYVFGGWIADGVAYQSGDELTITEDITFEAVWIAVTHSLPHTGGSGTYWYIRMGTELLLIACALSMLLKKCKQQNSGKGNEA